MKIRSLLLGSAAAAGLATGGYAADASSVLSALNACDSLGLSGITIASDDNCVQITGEVKWEGNWGDYKQGTPAAAIVAPATVATVPDTANTPVTTTGAGAFALPGQPGAQAGNPGANMDWASKLEWNIRVKATADTANGPASAIVKFKEIQQWVVQNEAPILGKNNPYTSPTDPLPGTGGDHTFGIIADEAYVSVGAANIWMVGKKGSLFNKGDDEPLNYLALFNSEKVDKGVYISNGLVDDGGVVIQTTNDLGNGFFASAGLERLDAIDAFAGVAIGVLEYKGDGITGHVTALAAGFLDGTIDILAVHAGVTATFDPVTVRAAIAADSTGYYNALATALVTLDMFKIAISGEAVSGNDWGVGGSVGATVADGIDINVGGRFYSDGAGPDGYQAAAQIAAAVTETIKLTAELGVYGNDAGLTVPYAALAADYVPGGGFTSQVKVEGYANGAYKGTVKAGKVF
jgi:hypothetical protein